MPFFGLQKLKKAMFASDHTKVLSKELTAPGIGEYESFVHHQTPKIKFEHVQLNEPERIEDLKAELRVSVPREAQLFLTEIVDIIPLGSGRVSGYPFFTLDVLTEYQTHFSSSRIATQFAQLLMRLQRPLQTTLLIPQNTTQSFTQGYFEYLPDRRFRWFPTYYFNFVYNAILNNEDITEVKFSLSEGILKLLCHDPPDHDDDAYDKSFKKLFLDEVYEYWTDLDPSAQGLKMTIVDRDNMKTNFPTFLDLENYMKEKLSEAYNNWCTANETLQTDYILSNLDVGIRH